MSVEIVTKQDLEDFRIKLLNDIKAILPKEEKLLQKPWLRSGEVLALLSISMGTLQNLCINDVLHPTKIGGLNYYKYEEIDAVLNSRNGSQL